MKLVKLLFNAVITLIRKMSLNEAIGFILTFLIIGSVFGLGFTLVHNQHNK